MLYIFYFADLQQIFKTNKIVHNAHSNNGLGFFLWRLLLLVGPIQNSYTIIYSSSFSPMVRNPNLVYIREA